MNENIIENYFINNDKKILGLEEKYKDLEERMKYLEKMIKEKDEKYKPSYYTTCYDYYEKFKFVKFILLFVFSKSIINDPKNLIKYYNIIRSLI